MPCLLNIKQELFLSKHVKTLVVYSGIQLALYSLCQSLITGFETKVTDNIKILCPVVWCNLFLFVKFLLVSGNQQDPSTVKNEEFGNVQEMSTKSIIVGPLNLRLDSSAVHRIMKMIVCALEHEYEPYCRTKPGLLLFPIQSIQN